MKQCPVCQAPLQEGICAACGYDASCDYEACPTLAPIPTVLESISARKAALTGAFRCPECGCNTFFFHPDTQTLQCRKCSRLHPLEHRESPRKESPVTGDIDPVTSPLPIVRQSVAFGDWHVVVLHKNGTVFSSRNSQNRVIRNWTNIAAVAAAGSRIYGLRTDGTVLTADSSSHSGYYTHDIQKWTEIVSISASSIHVAGLRSNGTVIARGQNGNRQCLTSGWAGIIAIATGHSKTVGLRKDGTVVSTDPDDRSRYHVDQWEDIISIGVTFYDVVGLRKDGTVAFAGADKRVAQQISQWTDIVRIFVAGKCIAGLRKDGTVVSTYTGISPDTWRDIIDVSIGNNHIVGLRRNGTVVAAGGHAHGKCDVDSWMDIAAIYAGDHCTVGVRRDGSLVCTDWSCQEELDGLTVSLD